MKQEKLDLMVAAFIKMLKDNGLLAVEVDVKVFDRDVTFHHVKKVHKGISKMPIYKIIKKEAK